MKRLICSSIVCGTAAVLCHFAFKPDCQADSLLYANVEALTQTDVDDESEEYKKRRRECFEAGGIWGYHSHYKGVVHCEATGTGGLEVVWNGKTYSIGINTKKGEKYQIPFTEYECEPDASNTSDENKNCCTKQGLYHGEEKVG